MHENRLLTMAILFFAAVATMAPLAFFAGLERGLDGMGVHAAELPQKATFLTSSVSAEGAYSGSVIACEDAHPLNWALLCDDGPTEIAPLVSLGDRSQTQSTALTRSVVAAIADLEKLLPDAPVSLAMGPDQESSLSRNQDQKAFTTPVFQGIGGLPGSLTPIALTGPGALATNPTSPPPSGGPPGGPPMPPNHAPPTEPPMMDSPATIVPLPAAISLFAGGLAFLLAFARPKQRPQNV